MKIFSENLKLKYILISTPPNKKVIVSIRQCVECVESVDHPQQITKNSVKIFPLYVGQVKLDYRNGILLVASISLSKSDMRVT